MRRNSTESLAFEGLPPGTGRTLPQAVRAGRAGATARTDPVSEARRSRGVPRRPCAGGRPHGQWCWGANDAANPVARLPPPLRCAGSVSGPTRATRATSHAAGRRRQRPYGALATRGSTYAHRSMCCGGYLQVPNAFGVTAHQYQPGYNHQFTRLLCHCNTPFGVRRWTVLTPSGRKGAAHARGGCRAGVRDAAEAPSKAPSKANRSAGNRISCWPGQLASPLASSAPHARKRRQVGIVWRRFNSGFLAGRWDRNRTCNLRFWSFVPGR
jgi:hypothetical protein